MVRSIRMAKKKSQRPKKKQPIEYPIIAFRVSQEEKDELDYLNCETIVDNSQFSSLMGEEV